MENLYLVAGLGNPGRDYAQTRHNAGFLAVEKFGSRFGADWQNETKFRSKIARVEAGGHKVVLCEPQTYMNSSGEAIAAVTQFFKIAPEKFLAVVDDADLPFGSIRMRTEGSSGGHHGLESIQEHLGTTKYARLRVGIGRTASDVREITGYVLGRFNASDKELLGKVLDRVSAQIEAFIVDGAQKAMNQFNGAIDAQKGS
jgi:PTH1 family peptidyl-tRNA hydrolase